MWEELYKLDEIKKEPFVIQNIRWDLEPKDLMDPKYKKIEGGVEARGEIKGYVFYIETNGKEPGLFLMRHTAAEYGETMAQIDEIPKELLSEAIAENKAKNYSGMYPINKKVEAWLKKELGIS
ncbi:MAG TPA: hypothetical protein VMB78_04270 [Dissulfurispiraceae bacterium]|nr:hypothetical protein [Dissulfurispiraceae bacterium]